MPYEVSWMRQHKIVLTRYWGDLTIEEGGQAAQEIVRHFDEASSDRVHNLVDITELNSHPTRLQDVNRLMQDVMLHDRLGWVIIYGMNNILIRFLVKALSHTRDTQVRGFAKRDKALRFLQNVDESLNFENI